MGGKEPIKNYDWTNRLANTLVDDYNLKPGNNSTGQLIIPMVACWLAATKVGAVVNTMPLLRSLE